MAKRKPTAGSVIDPRNLYTIEQFLKAAGIGRTTVRQGAELGVELPTHPVGRRLYVDGAEGIEYLKRLSVAQRAKKQRVEAVA